MTHQIYVLLIFWLYGNLLNIYIFIADHKTEMTTLNQEALYLASWQYIPTTCQWYCTFIQGKTDIEFFELVMLHKELHAKFTTNLLIYKEAQ